MQSLKIVFRSQIKLNGFAVNHCRFYSHFKILFFGTDQFSLPSLNILSKEKEKVTSLEVVTSSKTRKNLVKAYADENKIKVHSYEDMKHNPEVCSDFDLGVVVSFGHLIPESMIKSFKHGMLNVHASLLPRYRGASPIIYAISNHENKTGVTIMKIVPKKFDVGDILAQKEVTIGDDTLMPVLHDQLANIGSELLMKCIKNLNKLTPIQQDDRDASYAPKIENEFCKVRWHDMTALQVYDRYRSLYTFKPLLTFFNNETIKLLEISKIDFSSDDHMAAGQLKFLWKSKKLVVTCCDGNCIEILKLSVGKKVMGARDFYNGFLSKIKDCERKFE